MHDRLFSCALDIWFGASAGLYIVTWWSSASCQFQDKTWVGVCFRTKQTSHSFTLAIAGQRIKHSKVFPSDKQKVSKLNIKTRRTCLVQKEVANIYIALLAMVWTEKENVSGRMLSPTAHHSQSLTRCLLQKSRAWKVMKDIYTQQDACRLIKGTTWSCNAAFTVAIYCNK